MRFFSGGQVNTDSEDCEKNNALQSGYFLDDSAVHIIFCQICVRINSIFRAVIVVPTGG